MLFLNKLLPVFVLPLGWVFLLLLWALWRKKWWPVGVAAAVLYVCSLPITAIRLWGWLEAGYAPVAVAEAGPADAVVVLGGIFGGPRFPAGYVPNVAESVERLEAGIVLHQQRRADWLVFTGARIPWEARPVFEGEDAKRVALARGVPADRILVTREVSNTWDEARATAELMKERGWKRVILVTSVWHLPRAMQLFRAAGVEPQAFPVDYRTDPKRPVTLLDFLPKGESLGITETALREYYGRLFYKLTGR